MRRIVCGLLVLGAPAWAASWDVHFQATSIAQAHGWFRSPYAGVNSLPAHPERRVSLTATAFFSLRLNPHWELVMAPEVAGGKGFGGVTGIAGFPNGEIPRVSGATPKPYIARAFAHGSWSAGGERTLQVVAGKFAITDYFDNNRYSHDPRRQFQNWSLMSNGAWDYPADTRGYTAGVVEEVAWSHWSLRAAQVMVPTEANGAVLDTRVAKNRGVVVEAERRYSLGGRHGAVRALAFENREHAGTYREALAERRPGAVKYGGGANLEQELFHDLGAFARWGWNDGKTETWAFTEIDRSASGGVVLQGTRWKRPADAVGAGAVWNGLSGDHRSFLAAGGAGFLLGDGRLRYGLESIIETYYAWHVVKDWTVTLDYQRVLNPAYNRDRGPVPVASVRVHWER